MKVIRRIDAVAAGILLVAAVNSSLTGLAKKSPLGKVTGRNQAARTTYYSLIGAATLYRALRSLGPKTKAERRAERAAQLLDRADAYQHKASLYRKAANAFLKRRIQSAKAVAAH